MDKLIIPPNGSLEDAVLEHHYDIAHDEAFVKAANAFENRLEATAAAFGVPQDVVSDLCHLAADATSAAMGVAYSEGIGFGTAAARAAANLPPEGESVPDALPGLLPS